MTHNASASTAALRHRLARSTVALAAAALAARPAAATVFTWSPGGSATTAGAAGGTGNWDTSTYNWNVGATANTVYASSNASGALFGGTGGVVTITAPVIANSLSFNAAGYSFANASGSTLTLASTAAGVAPTINTGGYNVTLGLGNAGLKLANNVVTKTGAGTLTLTNDQSGSIAAGAAWTVNGGTLLSSGVYSSAIALGDGKELGTSTGNVLNLDAGSLLFTATGGAGYYSARTINVSANGGAISDNGFAPGQGSVGNNGGGRRRTGSRRSWPSCGNGCRRRPVLLCGVLPRDRYADGPLRAAVAEVNRLAEPLADGRGVHWLDAEAGAGAGGRDDLAGGHARCAAPVAGRVRGVGRGAAAGGAAADGRLTNGAGPCRPGAGASPLLARGRRPSTTTSTARDASGARPGPTRPGSVGA